VLVQAARSDTKLEARQHPRRRSRWSRPTPTQTLVSSAPSSIGQAAAGVARRPAWPCSQPTRPHLWTKTLPLLPPRRPTTDGDTHRALPLPIELSRGPAPAYESHRPRPHHASRLFSSQPTSLLYYHHLPHARGAQASRRSAPTADRPRSPVIYAATHRTRPIDRSIPCRPARRCLRELASDPKFPTAAQGASRQGAE
jgi:hypothetical protein